MGDRKLKNKQSTAKPTTEQSYGQIENVKFCYEQVNSWIVNADNKVSVSCGIFTGVFGVLTFLSDRIAGNAVTNECWHCVYRACFVLSLFLFAFSVFWYVLAINPNLGKSGKKDKMGRFIKNYPIFYGDIADNELDEYKNVITNATEKDFMDELLTETHYNSQICMRKMQRYRFGLWMSLISVVLAMIGFVGNVLMYR